MTQTPPRRSRTTTARWGRAALALALCVLTAACTHIRQAPSALLPGAPPANPAEGTAALLASHRWYLQSASDAQGRPLRAVTARGTSFRLTWLADSEFLLLNSACNGMSEPARLHPDNTLRDYDSTIQGMSTVVGCTRTLEAADAAAFQALRKPLQVAIRTSSGAPPVLLLTSQASGITSRWQGQPTLQRSLGVAPVRTRLQVATQTVPCAEGNASGTACLRVREVPPDYGMTGDDPGDPGTPWITVERIFNYTHDACTRAIIDVDRYDVADGRTVHEATGGVSSQAVLDDPRCPMFQAR